MHLGDFYEHVQGNLQIPLRMAAAEIESVKLLPPNQGGQNVWS